MAGALVQSLVELHPDYGSDVFAAAAAALLERAALTWSTLPRLGERTS